MNNTSSDNQGKQGRRSKLSQKIEKTDSSKSYILDLKVHTPVSLLGHSGIQGVETAPALVRLAVVKGLDVIAVTDLYSGDFIDKITAAASESELTVIPGVDIRCAVGGCEDITMTCLFPESFRSKDIASFLRSLKVPAEAAGDERYLIEEKFEKILVEVDQRGGAVFPSRIDKTPHRFATVPLLVEHYGFRAFDLAYSDSASFFREEWPHLDFFLFSFSNATALAQVGSRIAKVKMETPGFAGVREIVRRHSALSSPS